MRWNVNLSRQRIALLEAVVDQILGLPREAMVSSGYSWLKEEATGFFPEEDIKEFAKSLPIGNLWSPINVTNALLNAIDILNNANKAIGKKEESFSDYEMLLMRQEFIERLIKRLNKYNNGNILAIKEFNDDVVGFRWE